MEGTETFIVFFFIINRAIVKSLCWNILLNTGLEFNIGR